MFASTEIVRLREVAPAFRMASFVRSKYPARTMSEKITAAIRSLRAYRDRHMYLGRLMYESVGRCSR